MYAHRNFGFKIVDHDKTAILPVLDSLKQSTRPLEIGLYFSNPAATDAIRFCLAGRNLPINTHLNHKHLNIFSFDHRVGEFSEQIEKSLTLGADYSITHVSNVPMSPRIERRNDVMKHLLSNCERLEALCETFDNYPIYIENTYHTLRFYRYLFEYIREAGLANIHFCFDIGHAKVWSQESLDKWIEFLLELQAYGFLLHFHLHNNAGIQDDHLSFVEAQELRLNTPDYFTKSLNYLLAIQQIHHLFPQSRKVFEVKPEYALQNMEYVLAHLNDSMDPYSHEILMKKVS